MTDTRGEELTPPAVHELFEDTYLRARGAIGIVNVGVERVEIGHHAQREVAVVDGLRVGRQRDETTGGVDVLVVVGQQLAELATCRVAVARLLGNLRQQGARAGVSGRLRRQLGRAPERGGCARGVARLQQHLAELQLTDEIAWRRRRARLEPGEVVGLDL